MEGKVLLVNVYEVPPELLSSDEIMKLLLIRTIEAANMTPVLHTLQIANFPIPDNATYPEKLQVILNNYFKLEKEVELLREAIKACE